MVEFQYRGLPHAHLLVIFDAQDDHMTVDDIDSICCAELPARYPRGDPRRGTDEEEQQKEALRMKVISHMLHNDCENNPGACMCCNNNPNNRCRWNFPQAYCEATEWMDGELYPRLRRRAGAEFEHQHGDRTVQSLHHQHPPGSCDSLMPSLWHVCLVAGN